MTFTTFSPASDLETRQIVWSILQNNKQTFRNGIPSVETAVRIASFYSQKYGQN